MNVAEMNVNELKMTKRLRVSGCILLLGLLVEAFSLFWNHPLAFIAFATLGMFLILGGVALYLFSLLGYTSPGDTVTSSYHGKV